MEGKETLIVKELIYSLQETIDCCKKARLEERNKILEIINALDESGGDLVYEVEKQLLGGNHDERKL